MDEERQSFRYALKNWREKELTLVLLHVELGDGSFSKVWVTIDAGNVEAEKILVNALRSLDVVSHSEITKDLEVSR